MGCCSEDSVSVSKMALELKSGPMLWHKRRLFGSNWRDVHSVLYNDSSLLWYKDKSRQEQEGGVVLKNAPELIAFGPYTSQVPDRPSLPEHYEPKELLAFGVRGKDLVYWFLCPNEEEVQSWMTAITSTVRILFFLLNLSDAQRSRFLKIGETFLPPPPGMPEPQKIDPMQMQSQPQANMPQIPPHPSQAPPQPAQAPPYYPSQPPQYTPQPMQVSPYGPQQGMPTRYPSQPTYRPPPYIGHNTVHPQPVYPSSGVGGGGTTVVVQGDRPGYGGGGGGGDFAMGMLMGGAIGTMWGGGHHHHYGGWGGGWGNGYHGPSHNDTDITVNNYYDNDTSIVNNNLDMTNNVAIEQEAPEIAGNVVMGDMIAVEDDLGGGVFDGGDFGGGDYDGGDFGGGDFGGGDFGDF
ncbi:uncharacterized protein LOC129235101 [Uloborus diversus]|uniref:uncharacterized protein LOC129235101 n=1 Tax=Uloborus diversus TaxID=327109 RepID=UPI00240A49B3|nr:uncharacterized protein LOC129235101 [Uloborus diversus]